MAQPKINIFEMLGELAPYIFVYGTSVQFFRDPDNNRVQIKLKDLMIKDDQSEGIILENLVLSIVNLKDGDVSKSLQDASFVIESFNLLIPQGWVNRAIDAAEEQGIIPKEIQGLKVDFHNSIMSISGTYKKVIPLSFTVDFKFNVIDDRIVIDFDRFWAAKRLPMPQVLQKELLNLTQDYLTSHKKLINGVRFFDRNIFIDHLALMPVDAYVYIRNVYISDGFLVIQGGANLEETMEIIRNKDIEREKAQAILNGQLIKIGGDGKAEKELEEQQAAEEKARKPHKGAISSVSEPEVTVTETKTTVKMQEPVTGK